MKRKVSVEELLAKAKKPNEDAMRLHPFYRGKLAVTPKCRIKDFSDFAIWYTPGVASPCRDIEKNPEKVFEHTNKEISLPSYQTERVYSVLAISVRWARCL